MKMSQAITNVNTGKATTNVLWYGASGKADAGQSSGASFDQKLISMLMGDAKSQEGQTSMSLLALVGLTGLAEGAEAEGNEAELNTALENLLQDLPKLDEALQNDSTLLSVLQGWLQSLQTLVLPGNAGTTENGNQEASALPILAQHSETIRFAVQDALVQLISSNESLSGKENQHQVKLMLQTLQNLLNELPDMSDSKAQNLKGADLTNLTTQAKIVAESGATAGGQGNSGQHSEGLKNGNLSVPLQQGPQASDVTATKFAQIIGTSVASSESVSDIPGGMQDTGLETGNIVTAGQLALRDQGVAALKQVAKPVPVENFGKEMSGFLVNKLEIVKLQGVSEARISLYPEHLGQVDVKITMQNGLLTAQFVTEHAFAKESLEQQMSQLRAALQSQGLQVSKLEVTQNTALSSHMYHDEGRQSGNGTGQQQAEKRRQLAEDDLLTIHDLNEEWNEWIAEVKAKEQDYGSSFVARA